MKNFHKVALSIAVGALAIVFSAFTNAETVKSGVATKIYYHVGNLYQSAAPEEGTECLSDDNRACRLQFDGALVPSATTFSEDTRPSGTWTVTEQGNGSYQ